MVDPDGPPDIEEYHGDFSQRKLTLALSQPASRYAVWYLSEKETATVDDLADVITGLVNDDDGTIATPDDRQNMKIALYHVHLPKLESLGIVHFDHENLTVELVPEARTTEAFASLLNSLDHGGLEGEFE